MLRASCYTGTLGSGFLVETRQDLLVRGKSSYSTPHHGAMLAHRVRKAKKVVPGTYQGQSDICVTSVTTLSCNQDSMRSRAFPQAGRHIAYAYWDQRPYTSPPLPDQLLRYQDQRFSYAPVDE
jgi:hypothetical protein